MVDVNVHPAKLEVRFAEGQRLYSTLLGTLRNKFLTTDLTARAQLGTSAPGPAHDREAAQRHRQETIQWARGESPRAAPYDPRSGEAASVPRPAADIPPFRPFDYDATGDNRPHQPPRPHATVAAGRVDPPEPAHAPHQRRGLQVHNRYLITETDEGLVIIDQHALHERILYEQLRERVLRGALETQRLLVPEPVTLTATEVAAVLDARELLAQLGISVEPFGGDTILVSSYPAMLANLNPGEVLRQVVEPLVADARSLDRRDLLDELLHMISCKAAVKAGDRLSPEEVTALLEQRHLYQDAHHCPHGRPTSLVFSNDELDKRFKRI